MPTLTFNSASEWDSGGPKGEGEVLGGGLAGRTGAGLGGGAGRGLGAGAGDRLGRGTDKGAQANFLTPYSYRA